MPTTLEEVITVMDELEQFVNIDLYTAIDKAIQVKVNRGLTVAPDQEHFIPEHRLHYTLRIIDTIAELLMKCAANHMQTLYGVDRTLLAAKNVALGPQLMYDDPDYDLLEDDLFED